MLNHIDCSASVSDSGNVLDVYEKKSHILLPQTKLKQWHRQKNYFHDEKNGSYCLLWKISPVRTQWELVWKDFTTLIKINLEKGGPVLLDHITLITVAAASPSHEDSQTAVTGKIARRAWRKHLRSFYTSRQSALVTSPLLIRIRSIFNLNSNIEKTQSDKKKSIKTKPDNYSWIAWGHDRGEDLSQRAKQPKQTNKK